MGGATFAGVVFSTFLVAESCDEGRGSPSFLERTDTGWDTGGATSEIPVDAPGQCSPIQYASSGCNYLQSGANELERLRLTFGSAANGVGWGID